MIPRRRQRLAPDERRKAIVEAGVALLGTSDYQQVEVADIAREAGISVGLLYHYFPSKRDFYVVVAREATNRLLENTKADPRLPREAQLQATIRAYVDYLEELPAGFAAVHRGAISADPEVRKIVEDYKRVQLGRLLRGLALKRGEKPALELAVRGWFGFVVEASLAWIERRQMTAEELQHLFAATLNCALVAGIGGTRG